MSEDGRPAFPFFHVTRSLGGVPTEAVTSEGMKLRDYFAAAVAPTLAVLVDIPGDIHTSAHIWLPANVARHAYKIADAMLAEREKAK